MDRRDFLAIPHKKADHALVPTLEYTGARVQSGINPYSGPWGAQQSIHLLRRTLFGATKSQVDQIINLGLNGSVDQLLTASAIPNPPIKTYASSTVAGDPDQGVPLGSTWINTTTNNGTIESLRRQNLKNWWTGLMINQEMNIHEKLTLFWHNHFSTEFQSIQNALFCYKHIQCLRRNALGNLKVFVKEITLDPAMLRYLNGNLNTNTAPDENYARELQELFTVGKGSDNASPLYTEADVKAAAKVLTGWSVNATLVTPVFLANRHDTSSKTFSSYYNNTVVTGRTGVTAGDLELNDLLTMIFNNNDVALHICRKLYRWFVYYEIDAVTESNVIQPLADIYRNNNYNIIPVLSALFKSEHFYDVLNQGCIIKNPIDAVVGLCREFKVIFPDQSDYVNSYFMWQFVQQTATLQQQNIGDPPDVAGWAPYYQRPQFHEIWINSDTLPRRNQFTDTMIRNGYTRNGKNIRINPLVFAAALPNPGDPNALLADSIKYLLGISLRPESMTQIKTDILLTGQANDGYWSGIWTIYMTTPGNTPNTTLVRSRLTNLFEYLMRLAEYQLS